MENSRLGQWVLRVAVAGEFIGHGVFALQGKKEWLTWIQLLLGVDAETGTILLTFIGLMDLAIALIVLARPVRVVVLGAAVWDFVERWANWGAPLALLLISGWPHSFREWFASSPHDLERTTAEPMRQGASQRRTPS